MHHIPSWATVLFNRNKAANPFKINEKIAQDKMKEAQEAQRRCEEMKNNHLAIGKNRQEATLTYQWERWMPPALLVGTSILTLYVGLSGSALFGVWVGIRSSTASESF